MQSLQESISLVITLQAKNLSEIAAGKVPEIPIEPKTWDTVIKMVELMPKFKLFESIFNGELPSDQKPDINTGEDTRPEAVSSPTEGNAFEERSKKIKAKLNGETHNSTKKN